MWFIMIKAAPFVKFKAVVLCLLRYHHAPKKNAGQKISTARNIMIIQTNTLPQPLALSVINTSSLQAGIFTEKVSDNLFVDSQEAAAPPAKEQKQE